MEVITRQLEWERICLWYGYFTGRHLTNAWNRIVIGEMPVRFPGKGSEGHKQGLKSRQEEHGIYITDKAEGKTGRDKLGSGHGCKNRRTTAHKTSFPPGERV